MQGHGLSSLSRGESYRVPFIYSNAHTWIRQTDDFDSFTASTISSLLRSYVRG